MKILFFLLSIFLLFSCSTKKEGVFWCGDHQCINKVEREAYFKKHMIVERKIIKKLNEKEKKRQI